MPLFRMIQAADPTPPAPAYPNRTNGTWSFYCSLPGGASGQYPGASAFSIHINANGACDSITASPNEISYSQTFNHLTITPQLANWSGSSRSSEDNAYYALNELTGELEEVDRDTFNKKYNELIATEDA